MQGSGWIQFTIYVVVLVLITKPMGLYLFAVLDANGRTWLDPVLRPLEKLTYAVMGVDPKREHNWKQYTFAMLLFSLVGCLFTYAILRLQHVLPLNPQKLGPLSEHLAFNTAVSFTTNTNWQSYGGEGTMSYFSQMVGLAFHNFVSAATGIAIAAALVARHCAALCADDRQLLGRSRARDLLPAHPDLRRLRRVPDFAGDDPKLQALHEGDIGRADEDPGRKEERRGRDDQGRPGQRGHGRANRDRTKHRARSDGVADRDENARHEWRRLHQCQRRAALRKSRRRSRISFRCSRFFRSAPGLLTTSAAW